MGKELFANPPLPSQQGPWVLAHLVDAITTTPAPGTSESYRVDAAAPPDLRDANGQFSVVVGDEYMTVVSKADGSSPWTFLRAESGVAAAHSAGTPIYYVISKRALLALAAQTSASAALSGPNGNPGDPIAGTATIPSPLGPPSFGTWRATLTADTTVDLPAIVSGQSQEMLIELDQDATGGWTPTFAPTGGASLDFPDQPMQAIKTAGKRNFYYLTSDGASVWEIFPITNAFPNLGDLSDALKALYNIQSPDLPACQVALTNVSGISLPLQGLFPIDGYTPLENERVLVAGYTGANAVHNGLYRAHASVPWDRPSDYPSGSPVGSRLVAVVGGASNPNGSIWQLNTLVPVTPDTDPTTWRNLTAQSGSGASSLGQVFRFRSTDGVASWPIPSVVLNGGWLRIRAVGAGAQAGGGAANTGAVATSGGSAAGAGGESERLVQIVDSVHLLFTFGAGGSGQGAGAAGGSTSAGGNGAAGGATSITGDGTEGFTVRAPGGAPGKGGTSANGSQGGGIRGGADAGSPVGATATGAPPGQGGANVVAGSVNAQGGAPSGSTAGGGGGGGSSSTTKGGTGGRAGSLTAGGGEGSTGGSSTTAGTAGQDASDPGAGGGGGGGGTGGGGGGTGGKGGDGYIEVEIAALHP